MVYYEDGKAIEIELGKDVGVVVPSLTASIRDSCDEDEDVIKVNGESLNSFESDDSRVVSTIKCRSC